MPADDGVVTDEDFGEENHMDISNFPSTQLTAFAVIGSLELQDSADDFEREEEYQKNIKLRQGR